MIKWLLSLALLSTVSLYAASTGEQIYYFKKNFSSNRAFITTYRIKIGAFTYHDNALKAQKLASFPTYLLKGEKYYSLCEGSYHDKPNLFARLLKLKNIYPDAYVIETYTLKDNTQENFYKEGKRFFEMGDYESALALFDKEMILHPANHKAALEYARTLYRLGFYTQSKTEFLKVLASNPPENVQKNIQLFLDKIENKLTYNTFYGSIMIGLSYDDNLGYNTSDTSLQYGGIQLQNDTNKTRDFYENLNLLLAHRYQKENFTWLTTLYSYNELQQNTDISDLNFVNLTTAFSYDLDRFNFTVPLGGSNTWFAQKSDNTALFTQPVIQVKLSKSTLLSLAAKYYDSYNHIDSKRSYTMRGSLLSLNKFYESFTLRAALGYDRYRKKQSDRVDISKNRQYYYASLFYTLFKNNQLTLHYQYENSNFTDQDLALGYKREDHKNIVNIGWKSYIRDNHALYAGYTYLDNNSNVNSYSYRKNTYSLYYSYDF